MAQNKNRKNRRSAQVPGQFAGTGGHVPGQAAEAWTPVPGQAPGAAGQVPGQPAGPGARQPAFAAAAGFELLVGKAGFGPVIGMGETFVS